MCKVNTVYLTPDQIIEYGDIPLIINGIRTSTHTLSKNGWSCRIYQRNPNKSKIIFHFVKDGKNGLKLVLDDNYWPLYKTQLVLKSANRDVIYGIPLVSLLFDGLSIFSSENFTTDVVTNLDSYSDAELLEELLKRNPRKIPKKKKTKPIHTNIIQIEKFLKRNEEHDRTKIIHNSTNR
jgi:hypothetical protein